MISIYIPGLKKIEVKNVVFDFNGTIAEDGILIAGVADKIREITDKGVRVFVITSDTNCTVEKQCAKLPVMIVKFDCEDAAAGKKKIVEELGAASTVAVGNGRNDAEMFKASILSIAVIGKEGCAAKTLMESDVVVKSPIDAVEILLQSNRLKATLRT